MNCHAPALDPELVEHYRNIPTALISDCLDRLPGAHQLRPFHERPALAGRAFTVRTRPGDNLYVHLALDLASPGDVIVVDAGGDTSNAIVGEIMKCYAESRGIHGFVIHGAIRDASAFRQGGFQCYALASNHRGPYKNGPGLIGETVSIGGLVVRHGDLMLGDEDGLLSMSAASAQALRPRVAAAAAQEAELMRQIAAGTLDRRWLDPWRPN